MARRARNKVGGVRAFPVTPVRPSDAGSNGLRGISIPARTWSNADGTAIAWRLEITRTASETLVSGNRHGTTYNSGWIPGNTAPSLAPVYSTAADLVLCQWFVRFK